MKRFFMTAVTLILLPHFLCAEEEEYSSFRELGIDWERPETLTPEEKAFLEADENFDPWYAGAGVIGGSSNISPGILSITPLSSALTINDGIWDANRRSVSTKNRYVFNEQASILFGVTSWLDFTVILQGFANFEGSQSSGGFGDLTVGIGIPILEENLYRPAIRFVFNETFPTGRYQHLSASLEGLDATGLGSYGNQFGLRASKIILWSTDHPINLRAAYSYNLFTDVHVKGFNSYGGGHGASGTVSPGSSQEVNVAAELSLWEGWVFVCDLIYDWSNRIRFHGNPGVVDPALPVDPDAPDSGDDLPYTIRFERSPSAVGSGSSDQLTLAPAIQYSPNDNLSLSLGVSFNVYGRNVPQFVTPSLSLTYTF